MSWIRLGIAGAALLAVASVASAQAPQGGPPQGGPPQGGAQGRSGRMTQMLFAGIDLTDAQKDQIAKIGEKYQAQREALRPAGGQQAGPPDSATRAKMDDLRTKSNADYRAVLTADQQKVFDKNVADLKARMDARMKQQQQQ
ncbi:MAG: Spy/CpxP family protein refolding chaperone [Gemmatimonadaceae bacterium]